MSLLEPGPAPGSTAPPAVSLRRVAAAFVGMALVALVLVNVGASFGLSPPVADLPDWLQPWVRWDSGWYYHIAMMGYSYQEGVQSPVAFFPTYPLMMQGVGTVLGVHLAGVVLTVVSGLSAVLLFSRWCVGRLSRRATMTAVGLLLLYPYSLYLYGSVYADALFLACALGAFVLLERGHPWLAGLVGALAGAGRPVGVAVVLGLAVRAVELAWERSEAHHRAQAGAGESGSPGRLARLREGFATVVLALRQVRWGDAGVLLAGTGLAAYMAYQWWAFGNPLAFVATESSPGWDQGSGYRVWLKFAFFGVLWKGSMWEIARLLLPALLLLGTVILLPRIRRLFGWGYAVYTAVVIAIPIVGTKDFMGCGRYLLVAFPAFAMVAHLLAERATKRDRVLVLSGSGALLVVALLGYGMGYEVS